MSFLPPVRPAQRSRRQAAIARTTNDLLPADDMVANIQRMLLEAYDEPYPQTFASGRAWYSQANARCRRYADYHGLPLASVVGMFAALSPSTDIDRNWQLLETMIQSGDCAHAYGDAIAKARAILNGAHPSTILGGRKVRSFYRNVMYPHRPGPVTVDRHAVAIAYGSTLSPQEVKVLERAGAYQTVAAAYRTVARRYNLLPHQVQAITWEHWRYHYAYGATTNVEAF